VKVPYKVLPLVTNDVTEYSLAVGLFWALDFITKCSVSSLIGRLGFAAILGGAFFTAIWGRRAADFPGFFRLRILFGGFWPSCYRPCTYGVHGT
jgi:hypothetical protein